MVIINLTTSFRYALITFVVITTLGPADAEIQDLILTFQQSSITTLS